MSALAAVLPLWHPPDLVAVIIDVVVVAGWGAAVGYGFHRVPVGWFTRDSRLTRARQWEDEGRFWADRLRVRRWKKWLPEAGDLFAGGFSKKQLAARDPDYLLRFVAETRRAEYVHWVVPALGPVFFLWNPWWLALVFVTYLVVANAPCLVIQRYNRARLQRVLARVGAHPR
jgi:glycosyl-4,4'-diaponeurosporenoate acyltransferase